MKQRYYNLDLIKMISAVFIVFHHYQQMANVKFNGVNFWEGSFYWGYLVELFFLISGFVMAASDDKQKKIASKILGNCIRIYPSVFLACSATILIVFAGYFLLGEFIDTSTDYCNLITIISSYLLIYCGWFLNVGLGINNPTWYLCVLLLCYLIYYGIEIISEKLHINDNLLFVVMFFISCAGMGLGKTLPYFFTWQNQRGYCCFSLGILLFRLIVKKFTNKQIWFIVLIYTVLTGIGIWKWGIGSLIVLVLFFYPLIVLTAVNIRQLSKKFSKLLVVSYQVYLWHCPCFLFLKLIGKITGIEIIHSYFTMVLFVIIVGGVSFLIYKYFETPVTNWLKAKVKV